jgi:hypothetical protein
MDYEISTSTQRVRDLSPSWLRLKPQRKAAHVPLFAQASSHSGAREKSISKVTLDTAGWDQRVRALYDYWRAIHPQQRGLPGRQHFDPLQVAPLLPWLWLVDIHRDPLRFKFRLYGTQHILPSGGDHTGKWIDEAYPNFTASDVYSDYVDVAEKAAVSYRKGRASYHAPDYKELERVMLPLASDGRTVDMILAITVYFR